MKVINTIFAIVNIGLAVLVLSGYMEPSRIGAGLAYLALGIVFMYFASED